MQEVVTALNRPNLSTQESLKRTRKPGETVPRCVCLYLPRSNLGHTSGTQNIPQSHLSLPRQPVLIRKNSSINR